MKYKLQRDKVISRVGGRDLVGVYVKLPRDLNYGCYDEGLFIPKGTEILLAEFSPRKADEIIKLWNK